MRHRVLVLTILSSIAIAASDGDRALEAQRTTLAVAAASDLQAIMPPLVSQFERDTRIGARVSFGSSGNFFAQIQNGAPYDVFFSADVDYPRRLVSSGHAVKDSLYEYATGHLVVWTRSDSGIDVQKGLSIVADDRVRRIAIANPEFAPYGRAAVAALQHEQLYDRVKDKLVKGENISQAAQFAETGNAQVGLISLSLALGPALEGGRYVRVPTTFHPPIQQAAVVLTASKDKASARQLLTYLRRPGTAKLLQNFGFAPPGSGK
ncbi:MAG TPA: molybdate ABC transporter substrate-binding protein [Vicinamibacterales bacterium]|jgi:molybdate transport system substrate-binding protein